MHQTTFSTFESDKRDAVVNVASVPQRSPFRYPGGKTWFVPYFRQWIKSFHKKPKVLIEPFAGGGIISLTAAFEDLVSEVIMVEVDPEVSAVWQTIIEGDAGWLANRILHFDISLENTIAELQKKTSETREIAFQTILKNRTFHGGILAAGSGFLKNGENGRGILSRWYPQTIARRLQNIHHIRKKLKFIKGDAFAILREYSKAKSASFFIDPPYTAGGKKAGSRLYTYWDIDHKKLFASCGKLASPFILTYDNAAEVCKLAETHGFETARVAMKNTHHAEMMELVIGRNLSGF